jgi:hypothetical protein
MSFTQINYIKTPFLCRQPATKEDVELIKRDLREMELRLQKEIAQANNKTILWVIGIMSGYGAFFLGVLAKGFHWL